MPHDEDPTEEARKRFQQERQYDFEQDIDVHVPRETWERVVELARPAADPDELDPDDEDIRNGLVSYFHPHYNWKIEGRD